MANGEWQMANGERRMENGEWQMANGKWRMANGKFLGAVQDSKERQRQEKIGCGTPRRNEETIQEFSDEKIDENDKSEN